MPNEEVNTGTEAGVIEEVVTMEEAQKSADAIMAEVEANMSPEERAAFEENIKKMKEIELARNKSRVAFKASRILSEEFPLTYSKYNTLSQYVVDNKKVVTLNSALDVIRMQESTYLNNKNSLVFKAEKDEYVVARTRNLLEFYVVEPKTSEQALEVLNDIYLDIECAATLEHERLVEPANTEYEESTHMFIRSSQLRPSRQIEEICFVNSSQFLHNAVTDAIGIITITFTSVEEADKFRETEKYLALKQKTEDIYLDYSLELPDGFDDTLKDTIDKASPAPKFAFKFKEMVNKNKNLLSPIARQLNIFPDVITNSIAGLIKDEDARPSVFDKIYFTVYGLLINSISSAFTERANVHIEDAVNKMEISYGQGKTILEDLELTDIFTKEVITEVFERATLRVKDILSVLSVGTKIEGINFKDDEVYLLLQGMSLTDLIKLDITVENGELITLFSCSANDGESTADANTEKTLDILLSYMPVDLSSKLTKAVNSNIKQHIATFKMRKHWEEQYNLDGVATVNKAVQDFKASDEAKQAKK